MSTEASFVISYNFTTVRGDTYEEFVNNCKSAFGEEGEAVAVGAFTELRNHFLGTPGFSQAVNNAQQGLGAMPVQTPASPRQTAPTGNGGNDWVALDVPFAQKEYVKSNGAKWNKDKRAWSVPPGHALIAQFPVKAA